MPFTKEEMKAVFADIKANRKRLAECVGPHDFVGIADTIRGHATNGDAIYRKMKCSKCDGELGAIESHYYALGLKHGKECK